jgi:hypothetical protein
MAAKAATATESSSPHHVQQVMAVHRLSAAEPLCTAMTVLMMLLLLLVPGNAAAASPASPATHVPVPVPAAAACCVLT